MPVVVDAPRTPERLDLDASPLLLVDARCESGWTLTEATRVLREAGSGLADIVKVVIYLTDIRYREPVYRVMGRWLKGVYPVSTGLVVHALARPEWLVEIDATAVISGEAP